MDKSSTTKQLGLLALVALVAIFSTNLSRAAEKIARKRRETSLERNLVALDKQYERLMKKATELSERYIDVSGVCEGRLTLSSGAPVTTTDQTGSVIYFTPYKGGNCALYDGSLWSLIRFSETSIALSGLTSDSNYDVFAYNNSGALTLELGNAWASDVSRGVPQSLTLVGGIYSSGADNTRRYIGTLRAIASNQTTDTIAQRFIFNYTAPLRRVLYTKETTDSWTYGTNSWRVVNGSSGNYVEYIDGMGDMLVSGEAMATISNATGVINYYATGIGVDSSTSNSALMRGSGSNNNVTNQVWTQYKGYPGLGYHRLYWLERASASGNVTVWGDNGDGSVFQGGLQVEVEG